MSKYTPPFLKDSREKEPSRNPRSESTMSSGTMYSGTMASRTMSSGTMASLTQGKRSTSSYATNFAEQSRLRSDPNYVPPQKPVNISSENDFPTLGTPKIKPLPKSSGLVEMAKEWGIKIQEEEKANIIRIRKAEEDRREKAEELYKNSKEPNKKSDVHKHKKSLLVASRKNRFYDQREGNFKAIVEDNISDDSFESGPSREDDDEEEDEERDEEFNTNITNDRRHRDELY